MKAPRRTLHYAWVVLGALVVVMLLGSGLRAVFGVFIKPTETTFGWDRAALSGAAAISLLLLGAAGPIVGWLADQWGPRRVIFLSAILLGLGAMLSSRVSALWQIYITCGVLMGLGAGRVGMSTGAMNILGTVASGFICDRFGRKGPLAFYYGVRGLSLRFLLYVWNVPSLHIFAAIFGLNYISTVPPTTTLTANIFGRYSVGSLSGWIFFAHQLGAALGAAVGGWVFQSTGSYSWAFISAALLAFLAVPMALAIKEAPVTRTPEPTPAPAGLPATAS
jgi:MFS family permease